MADSPAKGRNHRPFRKTRPDIALGVSRFLCSWACSAVTARRASLMDIPATLYFVFGGLSVFFAALDLKVILQGGLSGAPRIARHLWRMCWAFFIAAGSFFLGQQKVMPVWMHGAWYLYVLGLAPLGFMIFWLIRVRLGKRFKASPATFQA